MGLSKAAGLVSAAATEGVAALSRGVAAGEEASPCLRVAAIVTLWGRYSQKSAVKVCVVLPGPFPPAVCVLAPAPSFRSGPSLSLSTAVAGQCTGKSGPQGFSYG